MKLHTAVLALLLGAPALPLFAQEKVERVVIPPLNNIEIKGYYTSPEDFKPYKGKYELSNGKELTLRRINTRMYAQVGTQAEHEVVRTGRGVFAALDKTMHIQLQFDDSGTCSGSMTYVDEDRLRAAAQAPEAAVVTTAMR